MEKKRLLPAVGMLWIVSMVLMSCHQGGETSALKKPQKPKNFVVEIKTAAGQVNQINQFKRVFVSHATFSQIRTDIPTKLDIIRYTLPVNVGIYSVDIPFEIIRKAVFKERRDVNSYRHAKVTLGNGMEIEGKTWGYYEGNTDLGKTGIGIDDIKEMTFNHQPAMKYSDQPFGSHKAVLTLIDKNIRNISGATFAKDVLNENGCYLDEYEKTEILTVLMKAESKYEMPWEQVQAIIHDKTEIHLGLGGYHGNAFELLTRDGKELTVTCPEWIAAAQAVRGLMDFGSEYQLLVSITLYDRSYSKLQLE